MRNIEVTLEWLSKEPVGLEDLPDKLARMNHQGGSGMIYFWIHNGKKQRIAYIGETGRLDTGRVAEHIKLAADGQYTAVDCGDGDLFDFYACHPKYDQCRDNGPHEQCPSKPGECRYFKPGREKNPGINAAYRKNIRYIYAMISEMRIDTELVPDENKEREHIRKEVEGLLIKRMLHCVKQDKRSENQKFCRYGYFWGPVSRRPREGYEYVIRLKDATRAPEALERELGWIASAWTFSVEEISRLRAL